MLRTIAASKTAKLLGTCVCPVVGAAGVTMAVPKVRDAVHRATAPREYALPKTRIRPTAISQIPCADPVVLPLGAAAPLALNDINLPDVYRPQSFPPQPFINEPDVGPGNPKRPPDGQPGIPEVPGTPSVPGVPEPSVWMQLIFGFTLVGGSIRAASRGLNQRDEEASLDPTVSSKD